MNSNRSRGILECPYRKGWIEFEYESGDRISDLVRSVEENWGKPASRDRFFNMRPRSWAFFCEDQDGAYLALKTTDPIPRQIPSGGEEIAEDDRMAGHAFNVLREHPGLLDVFFLQKYWEIEDRSPKNPRANYSMRLTFRRDYELPVDKRHSVHLLALVAIVGG